MMQAGAAAVPLRAVLFDLDGTLLDTADDIAAALNQALAEARLPALAAADVRRFIGRGAPTLIERALARVAPERASAGAALLARFYHYYDGLHARDQESARPFPGAAAGLAGIRALGLRAGVVTNKTHAAAAVLLERLGLSQWLEVIVGGDSCAQRKPHPQPLLLACESLGVSAAQSLMVGDSGIDVQAARAAGMRIVCVPYGYNEGNDPRTLPCDGFVENLSELPGMLAGAGLPQSA
jgi:phosphoglycolate phosphatase